MRLCVRAACTIALVAAVGGLAGRAAQSDSASVARFDAAISGVVLDGQTALPVAGATVILAYSRPGYAQPFRYTFQTDSQGRFVFMDLPAATDCGLTVTKTGFAPGAYGAAGPGIGSAARLALLKGQWLRNITISLWRHGGISGTVTDERGEPVVGAVVRALAQIRIAGLTRLAAGPMATTDDRGRYRIARLPAGSYLVYVPNVQMTVPADTPPGLLGGLSPQMAAAYQAGGQPLPPIDPTALLNDTTRLVLSKYPVPPPSPDGKPRAYPTTFAGGATSIDQAEVIELPAASERAGADIRLLPVAAVQVHGRLDGLRSAADERVVRLVRSGFEDLGLGSEAATALVRGDGSFTFGPVAAGLYTLEATVSVNEFTFGDPVLAFSEFGPRLPVFATVGLRGGTVTSGAWAPSGVQAQSLISDFSGGETYAQAAVTADGTPMPPVVLSLRPLPAVRGRTELDLDPNHPFTPEAVRYISLDPANGSVRLGAPGTQRSAGGEFAIAVLPGSYLVRTSDPALMIKSVRCESRDCTDSAIDVGDADVSNVVVTFTNAIPVVSGTVRDRTGTASAATVLAFPQQSDLWTHYSAVPVRIRTAAAWSTGAYRLSALPAGDYFLVAVPPALSEAWRDPEFLKRAAAFGVRVSLAWGEEASRDLVLSEVR